MHIYRESLFCTFLSVAKKKFCHRHVFSTESELRLFATECSCFVGI